MAKRGRKSKYESHVKPYLKRIPAWRRQGMLEEQVARKLGVGISTFERYKTDFEELREALKNGKAELVEELEGFLYKKAKGYDYVETKVSIKEGVIGTETTTSTVTKHIAPDTGAIAFALKNLEKEKWKDNHDRDEIARLKLTLDRERFELEKKLKTGGDNKGISEALVALETLGHYMSNPQPNRTIEDEPSDPDE